MCHVATCSGGWILWGESQSSLKSVPCVCLGTPAMLSDYEVVEKLSPIWPRLCLNSALFSFHLLKENTFRRKGNWKRPGLGMFKKNLILFIKGVILYEFIFCKEFARSARNQCHSNLILKGGEGYLLTSIYIWEIPLNRRCWGFQKYL